MPDDPHGAERQRAGQYRYLPVLTWLLLALIFTYFAVWFFFYRPSSEERRQLASFQGALDAIASQYVEPVDRGALYEGAMNGMVASLKDKYSWYLSPLELEGLGDETRGEFGGIGIVLSAATGKAVVQEVIKDGPAARAGVAPGDAIVKVDGEDATAMSLERIASAVRGRPGTSVTLEVRRGSDGETIAFAITREEIHLPDVQWEMLEDGIGLLHLLRFDQDTAQRTGDALKEMEPKGPKGLIVDLRGNAGGLVEQATEVADMFLDSGLIISLKGRKAGSEPPVEAKRGVLVPLDVPVVILVDRGTASAAEILGGALQANGRAVVVGTATVGKGAVTNVLRLPDGSGLILTVAHYELAGGEIIEGRGIEPDVVVGELPPVPRGLEPAGAREWYREQFAKARKEQLDRAVETLKGKLGR